MNKREILCMIKKIIIINIMLMFAVISNSYASQKKKIVILESMPVKAVLKHTEGFLEQMKLLDIDFEYIILKAEGSLAAAENLLREEIKREKPDIVVAFATYAAKAAHKVLKNTDIPIVFAVVADPVGAGVINKIGVSSGTNITGRVYSMLRKTKIDLVKKILCAENKKTIKFGIIYSDYPSAVGDVKGLVESSKEIAGVDFYTYKLKYLPVPEGLPQMLKDVKSGIKELEDKIDYWWVVAGPLGETTDFANVFVKYSKKPIGMGHTIDNVKAGALMSVNPDFIAGGRETAVLVKRIIDGESAGDIPVVVPEYFNFSINLKKALELGIYIPGDMLLLAGDNVVK